MHYRNGREAKSGDRVVDLDSGESGIIYATQPGVSTCNARLARTHPSDPYVTVSNLVHVDDVRGTFPKPDPQST